MSLLLVHNLGDHIFESKATNKPELRQKNILETLRESKLPITEQKNSALANLSDVYRVHTPTYISFLRDAHSNLMEFKEDGDWNLPEEDALVPSHFPHSTFRRSLRNIQLLPLYKRSLFYATDMSTPITSRTWTSALQSAENTLLCAKYLERETQQFSSPRKCLAYALNSSPGHHATSDSYGGYCFINNAAVAIRYLTRRNYSLNFWSIFFLASFLCICLFLSPLNLWIVAGAVLIASVVKYSGIHYRTREQIMGLCICLCLHPLVSIAFVLIIVIWLYFTQTRVVCLDLDYHAGQGTQVIFDKIPFVTTISLHMDPSKDYPSYMGFASERGPWWKRWLRMGENLNFPLQPGTTGTQFQEALSVALQTTSGSALRRLYEFKPHYLVIAFGSDTYKDDPDANSLGGMALEMTDYRKIGQQIRKTYSGPILVTQEGGYILEKVGDIMKEFLEGLSEAT